MSTLLVCSTTSWHLSSTVSMTDSSGCAQRAAPLPRRAAASMQAATSSTSVNAYSTYAFVLTV